MRLDPFLKDVFDEKINLNVCTLVPKVGKSNAIRIKRGFKPIEKTSSSPSDVIITELIVRDQPIPIAMKIFLDVSTRFNYGIYQEIGGLKYEIDIYKYITKTILAPEKSPNFIGLIGHGECAVSAIRRVISIKNLVKYSYDLRSDNVCISMTNAIKESFKFYMFKQVQQEDIDSIMFQLLYALALLEEHKILHNDLHPDNMRVDKLSAPVNLCFTVNDTRGTIKYQFTTSYILYIYDWDFSYCKEIGTNPKLSPDFRDQYMRPTEFVPRSDLRQVIHGLTYDPNDQFDKFDKYRSHASDWRYEEYVLTNIQRHNLYMFRNYRRCFRDNVFMTRHDINRVFGTDFLKQHLNNVYACAFEVENHTIKPIISDTYGVMVIEKGKHPVDILQDEFKNYTNLPDPDGTVWCYSNTFSSTEDPDDENVRDIDYPDYLREKLLEQEEKHYVSISIAPTKQVVDVAMELCERMKRLSYATRYNAICIFQRCIANITDADIKPKQYALASYAVALILTDSFNQPHIDELGGVREDKTLIDKIFNEFPNLGASPTPLQFIDLNYNINDVSKCTQCANLTLTHYVFGRFKPSEIANVILKVDGTLSRELTHNENRCLKMLQHVINNL